MAKSKAVVLNLTEAADYLGITPEELMTSRVRGLEPGSLGFKDAFVLVWRTADLPKPRPPAPPAKPAA